MSTLLRWDGLSPPDLKLQRDHFTHMLDGLLQNPSSAFCFFRPLIHIRNSRIPFPTAPCHCRCPPWARAPRRRYLRSPPPRQQRPLDIVPYDSAHLPRRFPLLQPLRSPARRPRCLRGIPANTWRAEATPRRSPQRPGCSSSTSTLYASAAPSAASAPSRAGSRCSSRTSASVTQLWP